MAGAWDQERERTEKFREEQLDWLHQQHEQMIRQTLLLKEIAGAARFFHILGVIWVILTVLGFIYLATQGAG